MIRIPYRYVLPLSAVMLTTALYFVGRLQQRGIEPGYWDGPPPRSIEIAMRLISPPESPPFPLTYSSNLQRAALNMRPERRGTRLQAFSTLPPSSSGSGS